MITAQVIKNSSVSYPFTYWGMYSQTHPENSYMEHIIEMESGEFQHYPYRLISFTSQRAAMRRIENLAGNLRSKEDEKILYDALHGLIKIYEKNNNGISISKFHLIQVTINQNEESGKVELRRHERFFVEVPR